MNSGILAWATLIAIDLLWLDCHTGRQWHRSRRGGTKTLWDTPGRDELTIGRL